MTERLPVKLQLSAKRPQLCLTPESELPTMANECIIYRDGAKADFAWTQWRFAEICWMMLNNNDPRFFLQVYQDAHGNAKFAKNKTARADRRAEWAWNSITGKASTKVGIGFYPTNINKESRWGAMDFDAHNGEPEAARHRAFAAFSLLQRQSKHLLLLGTSGGSSGGWHLFVYADAFYNVEEWIRFLEEVACKIGVEVKPGVCEIFPSSTRGHHGGGAIRGPGTWNPKSGDFGQLFFDQVTPALKAPLTRQSPALCDRERVVSSLYQWNNGAEKDDSTDKRQKSTIFELTNRFAVTAPRSRHSQLKALIGESHRCYGHALIRQAAELQHKQAAVRPNASLKEHVAEFDSLWAFFDELWRQELSVDELGKLNALQTQAERDAFRIIHRFALIAAEKGEPDFAISCGNLADRIGGDFSFSAVAKMRRRFESREIVRKTAEFRANRTSARFVWTAMPTAPQMTQQKSSNGARHLT